MRLSGLESHIRGMVALQHTKGSIQCRGSTPPAPDPAFSGRPGSSREPTLKALIAGYFSLGIGCPALHPPSPDKEVVRAA